MRAEGGVVRVEVELRQGTADAFVEPLQPFCGIVCLQEEHPRHACVGETVQTPEGEGKGGAVACRRCQGGRERAD